MGFSSFLCFTVIFKKGVVLRVFMVILYDVHVHLEHPLLKDLDSVIQRARDAGVKVIIANGIDRETNRKVLELAARYDIVRPALGIYPPDALSAEEAESDWITGKIDVDDELRFIASESPVAIGECGLDYKFGSDKERQKSIFLKLMDIAKEKDVPIIVHSRKAEEDCIDLLEKSGHKKVVMHCFSGRKHLIRRASDLGFFFSVPCTVLKSEHFQNLVKTVNISQLLTETDAPYLSPFPGKVNEPAFVAETVKKIADIKGMTFDDAANNLFMNFQRLF